MSNLTSPLNPNNSHHSAEVSEQSNSLDSTIETYIGDFGWAQLLQASLISFARFFDAQQAFIAVFADSEPTWHCIDATCNPASNICLLPRPTWSWDFPEYASTVSEWALTCSGSFMVGLPTSSFYLGCVLGGFVLGTLADASLGRKKILFLSCLAMALSTLLTSLSPNIWIYSTLRLISGLGRSTIGTCVIVLSTELVGNQIRGKVGVIGFVCFTLGFLSLPAIAYANKGSSWRNLYLWTSIPTICYSVLVYFFALESPRWLFIRGQKEDAIATLRSIANDTNQPFLLHSIEEKQHQNPSMGFYSAIKILIEKKWALRRLAFVMVIGFGVGMVDYGMPLALGSLNFSLYLSFTLNAFAELLASLVTYYLLGKLNRKTSILSFSLASGICSIMCGVRGETWTRMQLGFELVSYFSARVAYIMLLIFTVELFPTCVRNSAVSMVRQSLVFSAVLSPVMAAAGRQGDGFWSFGVFGVAISGLGFFVLFLPETRGKALCDTMDEEIKSKDLPAGTRV